MEIKHVSDRPVGESRTEYGDLVLGRPVVNGALVLDLLSQPLDHLRGGPNDPILLLLPHHLVEDGHDPILELAIVVVGDEEVANAIDSFLAEGFSAKGKVAEECWCEALLSKEGLGPNLIEATINSNKALRNDKFLDKNIPIYIAWT